MEDAKPDWKQGDLCESRIVSGKTDEAINRKVNGDKNIAKMHDVKQDPSIMADRKKEKKYGKY